ncbi:MAG TPA: hypothetical protein VFP22_07005 [Candidatus Limnocylindrales bacterium]|nr:hypothetical protein [Candidatus Limnocylindrales bacterium]
MDPRRAVVPAVQMLLATAVAILAVIGLFGTGDGPGRDTTVVGGFGFNFFIVLPQIGIVALGLFDWQAGRGVWILRAADIAAFALAALELSLGTVGLARDLAGAIALLAASGLAASIVVEPPRRAGWRR